MLPDMRLFFSLKKVNKRISGNIAARFCIGNIRIKLANMWTAHKT